MSDFLVLLRRVRDGETEAWAELVARYRPLLHRTASQMISPRLQRRVDASDIVQETFLEVRRDLPRFKGLEEAEWLRWLQRMTRRNVLDAGRRHAGASLRSVAREAPLHEATGAFGAEGTFLEDDRPSPSSICFRAELVEFLEQACGTLPTEQREVVRLRYLKGCRIKEIATHMDKSEPAVAGLLQRALRQLRMRMRDVLSG